MAKDRSKLSFSMNYNRVCELLIPSTAAGCLDHWKLATHSYLVGISFNGKLLKRFDLHLFFLSVPKDLFFTGEQKQPYLVSSISFLLSFCFSFFFLPFLPHRFYVYNRQKQLHKSPIPSPN